MVVARVRGRQPGQVDALAFQPSGRTLATYGRGRLQVWDIATGHPVMPPATVTTSMWSAAGFGAGGRLAFVSDGQQLHLKDLNSPAGPLIATIPLPDSEVHTLAISSDATLLATSSGGGGEEFKSSTVRLWDLRTYRQLGMIAEGNRGVNAIAFSPDGRTVALSQLGTAQLWDVQTRTKIGGPFTTPGQIFSLAFSPDGHTLATGTADGSTWLWDVRSRRQLSRPLDHHGWVQAVAISPDSKVAAISGGTDSTVTLWDLTTNREIGQVTAERPGAIVTALAFSPDGHTLAADLGNGPQLWDAHTLRTLKTLSGVDSLATRLAFSPDSARLAVAGQGIQMWDVATGRLIWRVDRPTYGIDSMAFSPDGMTIAASSGGNGEQGADSFDKTVRLLNSRTGKQTGVLTGHTSFINSEAFTPDSRTLATGSVDGTVRLWDIASHRQIGAPLDQGDIVSAVAIAPDGRSVAAAAGSRVRFWDINSLQEIGPPLTGHTNVIVAIAFSPNGQILVSGSEDNTARAWGTQTPDNAINTVCLIAARSLTRQEWQRYIPNIPYQTVCP